MVEEQVGKLQGSFQHSGSLVLGVVRFFKMFDQVDKVFLVLEMQIIDAI
jgi:hypothetical protein